MDVRLVHNENDECRTKNNDGSFSRYCLYEECNERQWILDNCRQKLNQYIDRYNEGLNRIREHNYDKQNQYDLDKKYIECNNYDLIHCSGNRVLFSIDHRVRQIEDDKLQTIINGYKCECEYYRTMIMRLREEISELEAIYHEYMIKEI